MKKQERPAHCDLSVIIPAFNAAPFFRERLTFLKESLAQSRLSFEIIPVDDGSTDETSRILRELSDDFILPIFRLINGGKFAAIKEGMLASRGICCVFTDADLPYGISPIFEAQARILKGAQIVVGDRTLRTSQYNSKLPLNRQATNHGFRILTRMMTGLNLNDTQCGFKAFQHEIVKPLFSRLSEDGFAGDVELLTLASMGKLRISSIPVCLEFSGNSSVDLLRHAPDMLKTLWRIRKRLQNGYYNNL